MIRLFGAHSTLRVNRWGMYQLRTHVSRAAKRVAPEQGPSGTRSMEEKARSRFPAFMRRYAGRIAGAPVSHITSFLIVHELTAVVPLFGLWGAFYYFDYVPLGVPDWIIEKGSDFIRRMAERNDWTAVANAERGSRIIVQGAAAYAVVKALMPLRLAFSLWAMPGFARWVVIPINNRVAGGFKQLIKRKAA